MRRTYSLRRLFIGITLFCIFCAFAVRFPLIAHALLLLGIYVAPTYVVWKALILKSTRPVLLTLNVIVGAAIFLIYFTPTFLPFPFGHSGSDLVDFVNTAIPPALGALVFGGLDFWFDEVRQTRIDH